jgi:sphingosine kinase
MRREDRDKLLHIPVGALPGGSGNAITKNIADRASLPVTLQGACFVICKGIKVPIDLTRLEREGGHDIYSFLSINWAVVSDIDLKSES